MSQCYSAGDFKKYFDENMQDLGLPVPTTLFDTYQTALGTVTTLVGALGTLGKGATMAELIGATVLLEKLTVAAAVGASAYTGAAIGSIAVASGRALGCGTRMVDVFAFTDRNNLKFKGVASFYALNPQILNSSYSARSSFGLRARVSPSNFEYA